MTDEPIFDEPEQTREEFLEAVKGLPLDVRAELLENARPSVDMGDDQDRLNFLEALYETREGHGSDEKLLRFLEYNTGPGLPPVGGALAFHGPPIELHPPTTSESDQR